MTRQQRVLQVLRADPGRSVRNVCVALRVDPVQRERRRVRSVLQALERKGLVRCDALGYWWAVDAPVNRP